MEVHMRGLAGTVSAAGFLAVFLFASGAPAQQPAQAGRPAGGPPNLQTIHRPPLLFREEWKPMAAPKGNGEHTLGQQDLSNPNLEIELYGDKDGPKEVYQANDDGVTIAWTGLCAKNCAVALKDKNNYADLTGLARIHWRTKQSGFHVLHPIVKLADGTWLIGDHADGASSEWIENDVVFADMHWRNLDIENVVEGRDGKWVENPNLSKVDEIGFTDLMAGSGHGAGGSSRVDWMEVYGKPVPREGGSSQATAK
jgi:hypothetical protein